MVFNATFNNISVVFWRWVLLVEETWENHRNFIKWCCIEYTSPWTVFELTTSMVIGTDCVGSCKSNYHAITTMTAPRFTLMHLLKQSLWMHIYQIIVNILSSFLCIRSGKNCMKILTADFHPTALSPYDESLAGQLHDADQQCANIRDTGSYLCSVCITNTRKRST